MEFLTYIPLHCPIATAIRPHLLCSPFLTSHHLSPIFVPPQVPTAASALSLELQEVEPLGLPQASPSRTRSPDVISSASTALSQDIPEIASEALSRGFVSSAPEGLEPDSMASAASALHLLSPRPRPGPELGSQLGLDGGPGDGDRHSTPSLLEAALTQEATAPDSQVWPTAPDITRETCSSLAER